VFLRETHVGGTFLEASEEVFEGFVKLLSESFELGISASLLVAVTILVVELVEALLSCVETKRRSRGIGRAHEETFEDGATSTG